jgi:hypothetical protein
MLEEIFSSMPVSGRSKISKKVSFYWGLFSKVFIGNYDQMGGEGGTGGEKAGGEDGGGEDEEAKLAGMSKLQRLKYLKEKRKLAGVGGK